MHMKYHKSKKKSEAHRSSRNCVQKDSTKKEIKCRLSCATDVPSFFVCKYIGDMKIWIIKQHQIAFSTRTCKLLKLETEDVQKSSHLRSGEIL